MITMMHCTITRSLSVSAQASARSRIVPAAPIPQRGARPCCSVWVNPHDPQREDQLSAPAEPAFFPGSTPPEYIPGSTGEGPLYAPTPQEYTPADMPTPGPETAPMPCVPPPPPEDLPAGPPSETPPPPQTEPVEPGSSTDESLQGAEM